MTVRTFVLAALAAASVVEGAIADAGIDITPPLYRDRARSAAEVRPASDLTTTPRPVPATPGSPRFIAMRSPAEDGCRLTARHCDMEWVRVRGSRNSVSTR